MSRSLAGARRVLGGGASVRDWVAARLRFAGILERHNKKENSDKLLQGKSKCNNFGTERMKLCMYMYKYHELYTKKFVQIITGTMQVMPGLCQRKFIHT